VVRYLILNRFSYFDHEKLLTNSFHSEYAGFDFDFRSKFPSEDIRHAFIKSYLYWWSQDDLTVPASVQAQDDAFIRGFEVSALQPDMLHKPYVDLYVFFMRLNN
jgi:hypothetical protein